MRWKFWQPAKSEAELSLEQLQTGTTVASQAQVAPGGGGVFSMRVEDVFTITGRGTVVTGTVGSGSVTRGQRATVSRSDGSSRSTVVTGIEAFRRTLDTASAGDQVGLLLDGVGRDDVTRGDVLSG